MEKYKVLFISQEIMPYVPENEMSRIGRYLPQGIQERGKEIRAFMPRFGIINERRNQLHEVIRLSGMNLIIDDTDHPLIIKVASIQAARMQIYFIDNEDYFHRKYKLVDDNGEPFDDNDERAIFFARGVLETVKKLRWSPDIIHCHGWFTSLVPLYIKKSYHDDPIFSDTKLVYSIYDEDFSKPLNKDFYKKLKIEGVKDEDAEAVRKQATYENVSKLAIDFSDGVIQGNEQVNQQVKQYAFDQKKPFLEYQPDESYIEAYDDFYNRLLS